MTRLTRRAALGAAEGLKLRVDPERGAGAVVERAQAAPVPRLRVALQGEIFPEHVDDAHLAADLRAVERRWVQHVFTSHDSRSDGGTPANSR